MGDRSARIVCVQGSVQGVGYRPFIFRLADRLRLGGWVRNTREGVEILVEGPAADLDAFAELLGMEAPSAAQIRNIEVSSTAPVGCEGFQILGSGPADRPTVGIVPDMTVCCDCLEELRDKSDRRYGYAYINCTNCGPRYSIIERLPYDRAHTTMEAWEMCSSCAAEYEDPADRRYHAQPTACPFCGPTYRFYSGGRIERVEGLEGIEASARALRRGEICAIKGIGGYHLACDARNPEAVWALRERKFRKEKPFAVMVRDLAVARRLVDLSRAAEELLTGRARPIVLASARASLEGVAPGSDELGVMLPYAPLHVLLFDAGAPEVIVMTSANRSSEPIAFRDDEAFERLGGIADRFLVGERPIARRVDDSVVRVGAVGPLILRRSRGYAPAPAARIPAERPILALGSDLKNTLTLVVDGEAFVSQHIGDLVHFEALAALDDAVGDLLAMYRVSADDLLLVHDAHPQYVSSARAAEWASDWGAGEPVERMAVQHHRAHIASVLAERGAFETRVVGLALDGTGYGDDGTIWGGEVLVGSVAEGFARRAHLRPGVLPGGDAAAEYPVQAAAGFLASIGGLPDLQGPPFGLPERYRKALQLVERGLRTFPTSSTGRLFDAAAALLGFTGAVTFEGQAAIWLEHLAGRSSARRAYPFPELDYEPLLVALIDDVRRGVPCENAARAFHLGLAEGFSDVAIAQCGDHGLDTVALSGGVFQNQLLTDSIVRRLAASGLRVWMNQEVPPNDGGISLGQAALAAFGGRSS